MNELPTDPAMLDRLEIIHVDGYDLNEKKIIAKNYLLPKFTKELKIENEFIIEENALNKLVNLCGLEKSGVRTLERTINLLMEKIYFFLHNSEQDYNYEWFIKMKECIKNINGKIKLVINESLID